MEVPGSNSFRLRPKRGLTIIMVAAMGVVTLGFGLTIAVDPSGAELRFVFVILALGTPAFALLKLSPKAYLEIGDGGFVVSVPTVWGGRKSEYEWSDCSEFSARKAITGSAILFNHKPTAETKVAKLNRAGFGFDAVFDYPPGHPIEETVVEMNRRRALVCGHNKPRDS